MRFFLATFHHLHRPQDPQPSALIESDGHIFIPVSPDDRHLGGTHKSASSRIELVLGPWTHRELLVAWPFMVYKQRPSSDDFEEMRHQLSAN